MALHVGVVRQEILSVTSRTSWSRYGCAESETSAGAQLPRAAIYPFALNEHNELVTSGLFGVLFRKMSNLNVTIDDFDSVIQYDVPTDWQTPDPSNKQSAATAEAFAFGTFHTTTVPNASFSLNFTGDSFSRLLT
jgi:hypothetical protein